MRRAPDASLGQLGRMRSLRERQSPEGDQYLVRVGQSLFCKRALAEWPKNTIYLLKESRNGSDFAGCGGMGPPARNR